VITTDIECSNGVIFPESKTSLNRPFEKNVSLKQNDTPSEVKYNIYGIMVTRSDHWVMSTWLKYYASAFRQLVVLDGSVSLLQREIIKNATLK
jgi:hypothetical protein